MTLETLITFLTIENNNMNNYIVTFEYRVMVTAFAILAMFLNITLCPNNNKEGGGSPCLEYDYGVNRVNIHTNRVNQF